MKCIYSIKDIRVLISFLFLSCFASVHAETISGIIVDEKTNKPVDNVVVVAYASHSEKMSLSNMQGSFTIEVPDNIHHVKVVFSHLGYKAKECVLDIKTKNEIKLTPQSVQLDGVVVKSNWIYHKDGKEIVNVASLPNAKDMQTDQVLTRIPGVLKSGGGGYSLNGKAATIFINGVKQNITAASLESFLSSLPANAVSSVELTTVNTGNYAASIESVIDIKTNPKVPLGYSIQPIVFSTYQSGGIEDVGADVFYMTKVGRTLFHNTITYSNERTYKKSSDSLLIDNERVLENKSFARGKMNVLKYQAALTYNFANDRTLNINTFIYNDMGKPKSDWESQGVTSLHRREEHNDLYNASVSYNIPSKEKSFYGHIAYSFSYGDRHSETDFLREDKSKYLKSDLDMEGWLNTVNFDFKSNLGNWLLYYGAQTDYNLVWDRTKYSSESGVNRTLFTGYEFLGALYAQARYKLNDRLSVRGGLRAEHTHFNYTLEKETETNNQTSLFPSLLMYYNTTNYDATVGFYSYILRPYYGWVIGGTRKVNDYISTTGNPDLKPRNVYALIFDNTLFQYAKLNLGYYIFKNTIKNVYSAVEDGPYGEVLNSRYTNAGDLYQFRTNIVLPFSLYNRVLTGQFQANIRYNKLKDLKNDFAIPTGRKSEYINHYYGTNINVMPSKRLNVMISGSFSPHQRNITNSSEWNTSWDVDVNYSFLRKRNMILRFCVSNLFAKDSQSTNYFLDNRYHSTMQSKGPEVLLSLKFKFGKGQKVTDEYRGYNPNVERFQ